MEQFNSAGFSYASPLTVDLNQDGYNDVLVSVNYAESSGEGGVMNPLTGYDFRSKKRLTGPEPLPGANFAITPYVGDLDNDVDVLFGSPAASTVRYPGVTANRPVPKKTHFARRELSGLPPGTIRWGAYMGEQGDACFTPLRRPGRYLISVKN